MNDKDKMTMITKAVETAAAFYTIKTYQTYKNTSNEFAVQAQITTLANVCDTGGLYFEKLAKIEEILLWAVKVNTDDDGETNIMKASVSVFNSLEWHDWIGE